MTTIKPCAVRGRDDGRQHLEVRDDGVMNTVTSVNKDSLVQELKVLNKDQPQGYRIYDSQNGGVSCTLQGEAGGLGAKTGLYAVEDDMDKSVELPDGRKVRIRKLTPRECFRLQGFPDEYFDRAASVNSDSQLYKQAGNAVTVNVVYEIARRLTID